MATTDPSWTDIAQAIGTWVIGGVGFWFFHKQNEILERQNEVMKNQADLNERLINREDQERDKADTLDAIEKLHLGAISGAEDRVKEYARLREKGLTSNQIQYYGGQLFPDNNGSVQGTIRTLEELYSRYRAVNALKAAASKPQPSDRNRNDGSPSDSA